MKVRHKKKNFICTVQKLNLADRPPGKCAEFIAVFDDGSTSSEYCEDYEPIDFRWNDLFKRENKKKESFYGYYK